MEFYLQSPTTTQPGARATAPGWKIGDPDRQMGHAIHCPCTGRRKFRIPSDLTLALRRGRMESLYPKYLADKLFLSGVDSEGCMVCNCTPNVLAKKKKRVRYMIYIYTHGLNT